MLKSISFHHRSNRPCFLLLLLLLSLSVCLSVSVVSACIHQKMSKTGGDGGEEKGTATNTSSSSSLDTSRADRAVWLLKVPPRVSSTWKQQTEAGSCLSKLILTLDPTKPEGKNRQFRFFHVSVHLPIRAPFYFLAKHGFTP